MKITIKFNTQDGKELGLNEAMKFLHDKGAIELLEKDRDTFVRFNLNVKNKKKRKDKEIVLTDEKSVYTYPKEDEDGNIEVVTGSEGQLIAEIIYRFRHVNVNYKDMFNRGPVRAAVKKLIERNEIRIIFGALSVLKATNGMPYAPVITTPSHLKNKLPALLAFIEKHNVKSKGNDVW